MMYAIEDIGQDRDVFCQAVNSRLAYRPVYVKIKLMYGCNLKCEFCNHWRETRQPPLPIERYFALVDDLASIGCQKIHLSGGEALLRPQVPDLVEHATLQGLRVTLTTNGTLVDKDLARKLIVAGLRGVNISLDSPQRKVHDRLRGVEGSWKKTTRAVEYFRRYAHKGKLTIRINTVISRSNYAGLAGMPDLAARLGADALYFIPVDDHCGEHLSLRRHDLQAYNQDIAPLIAIRGMELGLLADESLAYPFGRTPADLQCARRGEYARGWYRHHPCYAPWTHALIDYNGFVYVCCMTREKMPPLGDLKINIFDEIWNGSAYSLVREKMHPPVLAPCRRCDDFLEQNRRLLQIYEPGNTPLNSDPRIDPPLPVRPTG